MDMVTRAYIAATLWWQQKVEEFKNQERGAVDIIAIVVLNVIAVAVAFLFKDQIVALINKLFEGIKPDDLGTAPKMAGAK